MKLHCSILFSSLVSGLNLFEARVLPPAFQVQEERDLFLAEAVQRLS